jgi:hypothetical protein
MVLEKEKKNIELEETIRILKREVLSYIEYNERIIRAQEEQNQINTVVSRIEHIAKVGK